jgi:hypothetical protein
MYCDFVDYDEIAHHAGPARPEALAALEGIDAVLANLEEVAAAAPRPYQFVVSPITGRARGRRSGSGTGSGLEDLVRGDVALATDDEQAGPGRDAAREPAALRSVAPRRRRRRRGSPARPSSWSSPPATSGWSTWPGSRGG